MTYEAFTGYVADVLARLVRLCSQRLLPVSQGERILKWARGQSAMIWDGFETDEPVEDVAAALFRLSGKEAV